MSDLPTRQLCACCVHLGECIPDIVSRPSYSTPTSDEARDDGGPVDTEAVEVDPRDD